MLHRRLAAAAALALAAPTAFAQTPWTAFANVNDAGAQSVGGVGPAIDISANGRFVTFLSNVSLDPADTNGLIDVYVRDLELNDTIYVGPSAGGATNGSAEWTSISATGRYVVFTSNATNLGPLDTNANGDVYRKDLTTGAVDLVSIGAGGAQSNGHSIYAVISDSGRWVAFRTTATNIVASFLGNSVIVARDMQTGTSVLASTNTAGAVPSNVSDRPQISADGRYVVFHSAANNLIPVDANPSNDVFRKDLNTGAVALVSSGPAGQQTCSNENAEMSADGRYVTFHTSGAFLPSDSGGAFDVYLKDLTTGVLTLISHAPNGLAVGGVYPAISADGKHVSFNSTSSLIVAGKLNAQQEIFVRDVTLNLVVRVCQSPAAADPNGPTTVSSLSSNGRRVAMLSYADNIVLPDNNPGSVDAIVRDRGAPNAPFVYCIPRINSIGCTPVVSFSGTPSVTLVGAFNLSASNLLNGQFGTLFYSLAGPDNAPFLGGWRCVRSPFWRMAPSSTGGSGVGIDCTGSLVRDFNNWIQNGLDPQLVAGVEVWAQFYSRDPGLPAPNNVNLTEAIDFLIQP